MDVVTFVSELLNGLSSLETVQDVSSHAEGLTVRGRARFGEGLFLAFYYNQATGTQAFALVRNELRLWGIDYDNLRGWQETRLFYFAKPCRTAKSAKNTKFKSFS